MEQSAAKRLPSVEDYLRLERESPQKHEFLDGKILDMSVGTIDHSLIIANTIRSIGNRLSSNGHCRIYDSNLRVKVPRRAIYLYPDCSVICGKNEIDPGDSRGETVVNPRVIVEVLSESSERYDRGEKFSRYRELDSLAEYVLVNQESPLIETFFRQEGGTWLFTACHGLDRLATLRSLTVELPLREVYAGVTFHED